MQKEALLGQKYFTGCMALLTQNHGFKTCVGPEAFTSTLMSKKCVGKLALDGRKITSWCQLGAPPLSNKISSNMIYIYDTR